MAEIDLKVFEQVDLDALANETISRSYVNANATSDPMLEAQITNFMRTLRSKEFKQQFTTKDPAFKSVREKARKTKKFDDVESSINESIRKQVSNVTEFYAQLTNASNILITRTRQAMERELGQETPDGGKIQFYQEKEAELQSAIDRINKVYEDSVKEIEAGTERSGKEGFKLGERDRARDLLSRRIAFANAKRFIEANKDSMSSSELRKKAGIMFDQTMEELQGRKITRSEAQGAIDFLGADPALKGVPSVKGNIGLLLPETSKADKEISAFAKTQSIAQLIEATVDIMNQVKDMVLIPAKASLEAMSKAVTKEGIKGSEAFSLAGNAAVGMQKAGFRIGGTAAGAAIGSAIVPGAGTLVGAAVGAAAGGKIGEALAELTGLGDIVEITTALLQIEENTAQTVKAFSPALISTSIDRQIQMLQMNMDTASRYGDSMAEYQEASNQLQAEMYAATIDFMNYVRPYLIIILQILTAMLRALNTTSTAIYNLSMGLIDGLFGDMKEIKLLLSWIFKALLKPRSKFNWMDIDKDMMDNRGNKSGFRSKTKKV
jgi:hypothetical protein